jgi:glycosyltransferase involved in cell wall biosynthesis
MRFGNACFEAGLKRMRIAVDARLPWGSGIGRNVANCLPRIARTLPDCDFTVIVADRELQLARTTTDGLPNVTVQVSTMAPFSIAEQTRLPALYASYDLTWFTNYWVPLAFRRPFVATVYDLLHLEADLFPAGRIKRQLSQMTFAKLSREARGLTFISQFSKRAFIARFGAKVPMSIAGIGIDHDGWQPFDPENPPAKSPRILLVAAAKKHKNFAIALEAFSRARLSEHWTLTVVTPNDALRTSIDLAVVAGNSDRIVIKQGLSNDALRSHYGESAIVLMPSRYEGFGLPLVEGLQAGAQCISSTAEGLKEVGEGADVTFVDPDDLDGWVAAIEAQCARFDAGDIDPAVTAANMRHAMRYRWDDVARTTAAMIADALAGLDRSRG